MRTAETTKLYVEAEQALAATPVAGGSIESRLRDSGPVAAQSPASMACARASVTSAATAARLLAYMEAAIQAERFLPDAIRSGRHGGGRRGR